MRFITLDSHGIVIGVRNGKGIAAGEIESELGDLGQKYIDGKFVNVPVAPVQPTETMEEKIARLEQLVQEQNLIQMEVLATIFEELVGGA